MNKIKTEDIGGLPVEERDFFYERFTYWKGIVRSESLAIQKSLEALERYKKGKEEGKNESK